MEGALELMKNVKSWHENTLLDLGECSGNVDCLGLSNFKRPNKDVIAELLLQSLIYVRDQNDIIQELMNGQGSIKNELISSQQRAIKLQEELLLSKDEQLQSLQTTVKTSVENTVKAEFVSYSAQVQKSKPQTIAPEIVKTLVKTVVEEEDRSRSLMVFGLAEESDAQLCNQISEVFDEIGEKPRIEASRLGKLGSCKPGKVRPVKVILSNSATVNTILLKAKSLNQTERHSSVFICPDRSPAQRATHRLLVLELKEKDKSEPTMRHFIRKGKVCSVLKEQSTD